MTSSDSNSSAEITGDIFVNSNMTISDVSISASSIDTSTWVTSIDHDYFIPTSVVKTEPFVHDFPRLSQVQEMCKEYPGLKKAYENFKTMYTMVEQDWRGKNDV